MANEIIYIGILTFTAIYLLIYRRNKFVGSLLFFFGALLMIQPLLDVGVSIGIALLLSMVMLINLFYNGIKGI